MNHQLTMISKKSGMVMGWERKQETANWKGYERGETKNRAEVLIVLCTGVATLQGGDHCSGRIWPDSDLCPAPWLPILVDSPADDLSPSAHTPGQEPLTALSSRDHESARESFSLSSFSVLASWPPYNLMKVYLQITCFFRSTAEITLKKIKTLSSVLFGCT